jgi:PAS domain S-box-containing protein
MQSRSGFYLKLIAILFLGLCLTLLLFRHERELQLNDAVGRWDLHVEQHADELRHAVAHQVEVLSSLQGVFDTYGDVSREEFARFTRLQLQHHGELRALEWVPRVETTAQLRRYEQLARQDGITDFRVQERGTGGQLVAARPKAVYYPIYYAEPYQANRAALGFDLATSPVQLTAMERAAFSGQPVSSGVVPHLIEADHERGLVIAQPVYRDGAPLSNPQERKLALRGFVLGVYQLSELLGHASHGHGDHKSMLIEDVTDPVSPVTLFSTETGVDSSGPLVITKEISFAGHVWQLTASASPDEFIPAWFHGWDIMFSGLVLTLLLMSWYYSASNKVVRMETLAGDLQKANDDLAISSRELQKAKQQWERAFDAVRHPIFLHDQNGCVLQANNAYAEQAGQSMDSIIGKPYWHVFPKGNGPLQSCRKAAKLDGVEIDEELQLEDGSIFISRGFAIRDKAGEYEYSLHIMEDWTEKRRAEAQVQTHEARVRAVFKAPIDIAFVIANFAEGEGKIIEANPGAEELFGVSKGELAGCPMADLVSDESRMVLEEVQRRIRTKQIQWKGEIFFRREDCTAFPTEVLCYPVFSRDGTLSFTFCVIQDISDRRRSLELLQESEERFRRIFERLPIAYQSTDLGGRLLEVNQAWLDILGYPEEEVLGRNFQKFLQPEFRATFDKWFSCVQKQGSCHNLELSLLCRDGRMFEALLEGRVAQGVNGASERIHCVFTDITERKRNEQALMRASQALEAHTSVNRVVMDSEEVGEMVQRVCEVVVEAGDYPLVWVGLIHEGDEPVLQRTGYYIQEDGEWPFEQTSYSLKRYSDRRNSLAVRALLDNTILASNLLPGEPLCDGCVEWNSCLSLVDRAGLRSVICIPLKSAGMPTPVGVMVVFSKDERAFREEERQRLKVLANDLSFGIQWLDAWKENMQARFEYGRSLLQTVSSIARSLEVRDPYTTGHQQQVGRLAVAIAEEMGLDEDVVQGVELGALIHDIGQVFVPVDLLSRPGKLTETEFELIKSHPMVGFQIMADTDLPWPVKEMIYQHHERIDGSGYPQGLKGQDIVLEAKILSVADVVEAMISERPYRQALDVEHALEELEKGKETIYEAEVVDACVRLVREGRFLWEE